MQHDFIRYVLPNGKVLSRSGLKMGKDRATGIDFNNFGSEFGVPSGATSKLFKGEEICCSFSYFRKFTRK